MNIVLHLQHLIKLNTPTNSCDIDIEQRHSSSRPTTSTVHLDTDNNLAPAGFSIQTAV